MNIATKCITAEQDYWKQVRNRNIKQFCHRFSTNTADFTAPQENVLFNSCSSKLVFLVVENKMFWPLKFTQPNPQTGFGDSIGDESSFGGWLTDQWTDIIDSGVQTIIRAPLSKTEKVETNRKWIYALWKFHLFTLGSLYPLEFYRNCDLFIFFISIVFSVCSPIISLFYLWLKILAKATG